MIIEEIYEGKQEEIQNMMCELSNKLLYIIRKFSQKDLNISPLQKESIISSCIAGLFLKNAEALSYIVRMDIKQIIGQQIKAIMVSYDAFEKSKKDETQH